MTAPHAFLLAGGRGTRLRPLTAHTPKPMLPFLTEPVIGGWLRRLTDAGITDVHLLVAADPRPFVDTVSTGRRLGLRVTVHTETSPLHSGGALRAAADAHHGQVLVINADIVTDAPIDDLVAEHGARAADATILTVLHERPSDYGVMRLDGDRLVASDEKPAGRNGPAWINAGVYVLAASVLDRLPPTGPCDLEADVFPSLAASDAETFASRWPGGWADLGTPQRYLDAHRAALDGRLPWPTPPSVAPFAPGVLCHRGAEVDRDASLRAPIIIGADARVGAGAVIGPYATIGRYATVGRSCQIRDSVVLDHTHVPAGTRTRRNHRRPARRVQRRPRQHLADATATGACLLSGAWSRRASVLTREGRDSAHHPHRLRDRRLLATSCSDGPTTTVDVSTSSLDIVGTDDLRFEPSSLTRQPAPSKWN